MAVEMVGDFQIISMDFNIARNGSMISSQKLSSASVTGGLSPSKSTSI